jgi:hypothetical protein
VLIWLGELPCLHPRRGLGLSSRTVHAHVIRGAPHPRHRTRTLRSRRAGSVAKGLPTRFSRSKCTSSDTKAGDSGASILQDGQSVCRRPTAFSLIGPAPRRNVRYARQRPLTARAREPSITAATRAVIERAWLSWPRLVWSSARLTARIYQPVAQSPIKAPAPRRSRVAWEHESQMLGLSRSSRRLCNRLIYATAPCG